MGVNELLAEMHLYCKIKFPNVTTIEAEDIALRTAKSTVLGTETKIRLNHKISFVYTAGKTFSDYDCYFKQA